MNSNMMKLGGFIRQTDVRNTDNTLGENDLFGLSVSKEFIATHANLVGVSFESYKVVKDGQFAYIPDTSRRGDKIAIARNTMGKSIIVSSIQCVFEIVDDSKLDPGYLMLWFMRSEFDRYARYMSNGSAREVFDWDCMCNVDIPVPPIEEQRKIVRQYKVVTERIDILKEINTKLEQIALSMFNNEFGSIDVHDSNTIVPNFCSIVKADTHFNITIGKTPPRENGECFTFNDADITWVSIADMKNANPYILHSSENLSKEAVTDYNVKLVPANSILLSFKLTVGRVAIADKVLTTNEAIAHFPCTKEELPFMYCMFKLYRFEKLGSTSSISTAINSNIIKGMPILIPNEDVMNRFNKKTAPLFNSMKYNSTEIAALKKMRLSFIKKM